jgi:predicted GNAT family acetyltransferase
VMGFSNVRKSIKLSHYDDPAQFLAHAKQFLEALEAENNLILGISLWLAGHPERLEHEPYFAIVEENDRIEAAAMMTPPYKLGLTRAKTRFLDEIVEDLSKRRIVLPGVNGPKETSRAFAERWAKKETCTYQLHRSLRIYQLSHVIPPRPVNGRMRLALPTERDVLVQWAQNFGDEIGEPQTNQQATEMVERAIGDERVYVWDDDGLRSMAAWSSPTTHGIRINLVYTPPELRGQGYASACVAALSQAMLNSGRRFCYLFTDLSNPVSNQLYQRIGYVPVCDFAEYRFT